MVDIYVKGVAIEESRTNFEDWEWGDVDAAAVNMIRHSAAELVASEILSSMTVHMEVNGDAGVSAIWSTEAIDDAFFAFDLSAVTAGAVESIETNYMPQHVAEHRPETIRHLTALKNGLQMQVQLVESAIEEQVRKMRKGE